MEEVSFSEILLKQTCLQDVLGRLSLISSLDMAGKTKLIMEEIFNINKELGEMMSELPFKTWKKYSPGQLSGWVSSSHRDGVLEEYVDALHFFLNIAVILGFSSEEIGAMYFSKNKENHDRQKRGY